MWTVTWAATLKLAGFFDVGLVNRDDVALGHFECVGSAETNVDNKLVYSTRARIGLKSQ